MAIQTAIDSINNSSGSPFGFKNRIINGAMVIAQRATSAALQFSSTNYTALDRFCGFMAGASQSGTFSRVAITDLTGFNYCAKLQRTAAGTNTANIEMGQAIETLNCADLAGQTVTLSFYLKAGANFSASGSNVFVQLASGTGTDQSFSNMTGSLWTNQVNIVNFASQAITTSWVRYSYTATLGSTVSQLGFQVGWTPVGTAGADDSLYITGVQLEKGSVATAFDYRPHGTELQLCQRYYYTTGGDAANQLFALGQAYTTSLVNGIVVPFPVTMRTTPTFSASAVSDFFLQNASGSGGVVSAISQDAFEVSSKSGNIRATRSAAGLTAGHASILFAGNTSARLNWSSEL